jgi:hypothetical protein
MRKRTEDGNVCKSTLYGRRCFCLKTNIFGQTRVQDFMSTHEESIPETSPSQKRPMNMGLISNGF